MTFTGRKGMSEILSLTSPVAERLEITRSESSVVVSMTIRDGESLYEIRLTNPDSLDVFPEIFDAQSIWAVDNKDGQLEYGGYDFFVMVDATYDCRVDSITIDRNGEQEP